MTENIDGFSLFLEARQFAAMLQDGDIFDFVEARFDSRHDTGPWSLEEPLLIFGRNGAILLESGQVQLDMPYVRYPEEHEYVACL